MVVVIMTTTIILIVHDCDDGWLFKDKIIPIFIPICYQISGCGLSFCSKTTGSNQVFPDPWQPRNSRNSETVYFLQVSKNARASPSACPSPSTYHAFLLTENVRRSLAKNQVYRFGKPLTWSSTHYRWLPVLMRRYGFICMYRGYFFV